MLPRRERFLTFLIMSELLIVTGYNGAWCILGVQGVRGTAFLERTLTTMMTLFGAY
jgi:hypothetical protein